MRYDKNRTLEAVLFDMDGVIVDSEPLWSEAERQLLARRGVRYSPQLKSLLMGLGSREAIGLLIEHYQLGERVEDLVVERDRLIANLFEGSLQPMPDVFELITTLRDRGIKTALASSSPEALIALVLDKFSITGFFDLVLSGDQLERSKPAPDIFLAAAKALEVAPENCLVIEDAPHGVAAAKAAGMCCLAISASVNPSELAGADGLVRSFAEVDLSFLQSIIQRDGTP